jgi:hypothetical protein
MCICILQIKGTKIIKALDPKRSKVFFNVSSSLELNFSAISITKVVRLTPLETMTTVNIENNSPKHASFLLFLTG